MVGQVMSWMENSPRRGFTGSSLRNLSFAESLRFAMRDSSGESGDAEGVNETSRTVFRESLDATDDCTLFTDTESAAIFLESLMSGVDDPTGVFDTLEMVTVVLIDWGCCFSNARCLLSVANDMTIWSQCDERSFLACRPSSRRKSRRQSWEIIFLISKRAENNILTSCLPFPETPSSLGCSDRWAIARQFQSLISSLLAFPKQT